MSKTLKSGRLIVMSNGEKKIIKLSDGGGVRTTTFNQQTSTFRQIHQLLREKYEIKGHVQTILYDFQQRQIQYKRDTLFIEYMNRYGLDGRPTAIFLGTHERDHCFQPKKKSNSKVKQLTNKLRLFSLNKSKQTTLNKTLNSKCLSKQSHRQLVISMRSVINNDQSGGMLHQLEKGFQEQNSDWSTPPPPFLESPNKRKRPFQPSDDHHSVIPCTSIDEGIIFLGVTNAYPYSKKKFRCL